MPDSIDYIKLYERLGVKIKDVRNTEAIGLCPFHDDNKNSFAFDTEHGLWKCFAGDGQGNIHHFISKKYNVVLSDAEDVLHAIINPITEDIALHHEALLNNKKVLEIFIQKRGYSIETIKKFTLGYDGDRFTIPIFIGDVLVNIRKYSLEGGRAKMLNVQNYGAIKLFPYYNLTEPRVFIFEGETDAILANQLGIPGVSVTSGAGSWRKEWGVLLRDKDVVICYDIDAAGKKGAMTVAEQIKSFAKSVKVINLPINEPKNADFTNYIKDFSHTADDFLRLCESVETRQTPTAQEAEIKVSDEICETTLKNSSNKDFYFKRIRVPVIVSGKDLTPFIVPRKIKAKCLSVIADEKTVKLKCLYCPLSKTNEAEFIIDETSQTLLNLTYSSDEQVKGHLRETAKIPKTCHKFKLDVVETQNVEELRIIPDVDYTTTESEYVARTVYYTGAHIKTNAAYLIEGVAMPNPRNQYSTMIINKAMPRQTNIDVFKMSPDIMRRLRVFQPIEGQRIESKLDEIYQDFTYNVTKIYHRQDLLTAIDLAFFSVLEFDFMKEFINKGYVEVLVLGDTRCGKTKSIQSMVEHYHAGEFITGENMTFAGLVGGMSQIGNKWHITWGKLPLNDRRLVVIDELSSMSEETISNLSAVRSSGTAEIVKIQTEKTRARCRLLCLSNPRSGRKLNSYNHGILAVKELIGKVEDIARFDLAITVASDDVDLSEIQKEIAQNIPHKYTSELNQLLILWAWSRTKKDIVFLDKTLNVIIDVSNELSRVYSSAIPLVEPAEQRVKIARLSAALAARLFSTDESGEKVIVKPEHVEFIFKFLKLIYNKKSMGYNLFSTNQFSKTRISATRQSELIAEFKKKFKTWDIIRDVLLESQYFRKNEFVDQTGIDKDEAREFFRWSSVNRLIRSTSGGYTKNPIFTALLKDILNDVAEPVEDDMGDF